MTLSRAHASNRSMGSRLLAPAVLAAFMAFASTGVAYAQPSDDRDCQATAGMESGGQVPSDGASTGENFGNCGGVAPPPILATPLAPLLCGTGAFCVP